MPPSPPPSNKKKIKNKNINTPAKIPVRKKEIANLLDKECVTIVYSNKIYSFCNKEKKPTGNRIFKCTKSKAEINEKCNPIKGQNGKNGFAVKENSTYIFLKHFHAADTHGTPCGTQHSQIKWGRPKLYSWKSPGEGLGKIRNH